MILGPTSSGKSDTAIKLAKKFNGEVISADSRQVYRGMNIGTGKIASDFPVLRSKGNPEYSGQKAKLQVKSKKLIIYWSDGIAHHLIDVASPRTEYNISKFRRAAEKAIKDILCRGKLPIICGGTGFWIKAIVDDVVFPEVKPNKELRGKLQKLDAEKLFQKLQKSDPERAVTIDRHNKVRLVRALEIVAALGQVPKPREKKRTDYEFMQVGLDCPKEKLYQRIQERLEARFKHGMIREVSDLHFKDKISWKRLENFGLEYRFIALYLQGKISEMEMKEKLFQASKDYAKRQMTWFRKDKRVIWLKDYAEIEKEAWNFIKN